MATGLSEAISNGISLEISLTVNGSTRTVPTGTTLAQLLTILELDPRMIVVEHNGEIVRDRDSLGARTLVAGDTIELVHFVGGG